MYVRVPMIPKAWERQRAAEAASGAAGEVAPTSEEPREHQRELPASEATPGDATLCTGPKCTEGRARGAEPGLVARNGLCWRCHNLGRRQAAQQVLMLALADHTPDSEAGNSRAVLLLAPAAPRTVLEQYVRPAGVLGANAQHVSAAMRRTGLTPVGPGGRAISPVPTKVWEARCRCPTPAPHPELDWACEDCGLRWGHDAEQGDDSACRRCGSSAGMLAWCPGCQAFSHAEPEGTCEGWHEGLRGRDGLCPVHSAQLARLWWAAREGADAVTRATLAAAEIEQDGVNVPYPGAEPGPPPPEDPAHPRTAEQRQPRGGGRHIYLVPRRHRLRRVARGAPVRGSESARDSQPHLGPSGECSPAADANASLASEPHSAGVPEAAKAAGRTVWSREAAPGVRPPSNPPGALPKWPPAVPPPGGQPPAGRKRQRRTPVEGPGLRCCNSGYSRKKLKENHTNSRLDVKALANSIFI